MAQAIINSAIAQLDPTSLLYDLYTRLYDGMSKANQVDAPDYTTDPPFMKNEDGSVQVDENGVPIVDNESIQNGLAEYTDILLKNSAYMLANAIIATVSPNGGEGGTSESGGFLFRNGDTMQGALGALYGFEAGYNNTKIFETIIDSSEKPLAIVSGDLNVSKDAHVEGSLHLSNSGIVFGETNAIYYDQSTLNIVNESVNIIGEISVDGLIHIGDVEINEDGVFYQGEEFYHSGNCNKNDVDWTMNNGNVYGQLTVKKESILEGPIISQGGFTLNLLDLPLLYSEVKETLDSEGEVVKTPYMVLNSDLSIVNNHGIKFNDNYIVWVRNTNNLVSFSAPGAVMNLGDSGVDSNGEKLATQYIALQTNIKNYNGAYNIITHDGTGNFPNGFSAGVANSVGTAIQTYYKSTSDFGIVVNSYLHFGTSDGPGLYGDSEKLKGVFAFRDMSGSLPATHWIESEIYCSSSSSLVFNPTSNLSFSSLHVNTNAIHFEFDKPIEVTRLAIKSATYKTRLEEDVLFFDDGKFIEGIEGGLRHSQNSLFDGDLFSFNPDSSSISFSSGFAGSGWAIMSDVTSGDFHATFDNLTIRKKMRVYELEVQKMSVTNGSLWVSDSCSGDEVRELN